MEGLASDNHRAHLHEAATRLQQGYVSPEVDLTLLVLKVGDAASFVFRHLRPSYRLG
jgi:hypothetical protein